MNNDRTLILFPGALGDFLCLWPALDALSRRSRAPLTLAIKPDLFDLVPRGQYRLISIDAREVADLFASGPPSAPTLGTFAGHGRVHSFAGAGDESFARRLAEITGGSVGIHRIRGMAKDEHASRHFARCLAVSPSIPLLVPDDAALGWVEGRWREAQLGDRALAVHPGSGGRAKNWRGMAEIAQRWRSLDGARVVLIIGPAERGTAGFPHDFAIRNESLSRVAAMLKRAAVYLGNDSGISHLAGLVGARGTVLFGASDPAVWRPNGFGLEVLAGRPDCAACDPADFCTHRLTVEDVWRSLARRAAQNRTTSPLST